MMKKTAYTRSRQAKLLVAVALTFTSAAAYALPGDGFSANLGFDYIHDNNVFRLPGNVSPASVGITTKDKRSDDIYMTTIGGSFDKRISLQEVHLKATYIDNRFSEYSDFNNHNIDYSALWNWRLGRLFSGELSYSQDEFTSNFGDTRTNGPNVRRDKRAAGSVYFEFAPRWEAFVGASQLKGDNSRNDFTTGNIKYDIIEGGLRFSISDATKVRLLYRNTDGDYPNQIAGSSYKFKQHDYEANGSWQVTGKSNLIGAIAYSKRDYDFQPQFNFSGVTGSLAWDYVLSGTTSFRFDIGRDLYGIQDLTSAYILTDRYGVAVTYLLTSKITLTGLADKRNRSYRGNSNFAGSIGREDDTKAYQLTANYNALRNLNLGLYVRKEDRSSNNNFFEYNDRTIGARVGYTF